MKNFYDITDVLYDYLISHNSINQVFIGNINEVDLNKQTIYPIAQIIVGDAQFIESTIQFDVQVLVMDSVVYSNKSVSDVRETKKGLNNKQDVYNTMLAVVNGLQKTLRNGTLFDENYHLAAAPIASPFEDNFGNLLTGWALDFTVITTNTQVGDCDFRIAYTRCTPVTFDNNQTTTWDAN